MEERQITPTMGGARGRAVQIGRAGGAVDGGQATALTMVLAGGADKVGDATGSGAGAACDRQSGQRSQW